MAGMKRIKQIIDALKVKDLAAAARAALVPTPDPTPVWQGNPDVPQG